MSGKPRKVLLEPAVQKEFQRIKVTEDRGEEAIKGFTSFLAKMPELGNAVRNAPGS